MFSRFRVAVWFAIVLALTFAVPVFAGGWAVITLDSLPAGVVAGEPLTLGFTVLQHGRTPMTGLAPTITATLSKDEKFVVDAEPEGKPGHYTATLTFPTDGEWRWSIQAFSMDQLMPPLIVAASVAGSKNNVAVNTESTNSISLLWVIRVLALGMGATGFVLALQRKSRMAIAATVFCLFIGAGSFFTGTGSDAKVGAHADWPSKTGRQESMSQVDLGGQLFVAKGCITCHVNRKISNSSEYWTIDVGATDLSNFSASPEALFLRLKDPASVKSDTKMPNLGLREEEIEALIAFINSK